MSELLGNSGFFPVRADCVAAFILGDCAADNALSFVSHLVLTPL